MACEVPGPRSESLVAWLQSAFASPEYAEWRTGTSTPVVPAAGIELVGVDSLCQRAWTAISVQVPAQHIQRPVHLVRLGDYGYAATHDSLRTTASSVLVVMDTTFAPRFTAFWTDLSGLTR